MVYNGTGKLSDLRKEYLLQLLLNNIVNNAHNHINYTHSGFMINERIGGANVTLDNFKGITTLMEQNIFEYKSPEEVDHRGEFTSPIPITTPDGKVFAIFVGHQIVDIGENVMESPRMMLWHGIGHVLTVLQFGENGSERTKQRETVGFENFVRELAGLDLRNGNNHSDYPGYGGYYQTEALKYAAEEFGKLVQNALGNLIEAFSRLFSRGAKEPDPIRLTPRYL